MATDPQPASPSAPGRSRGQRDADERVAAEGLVRTGAEQTIDAIVRTGHSAHFTFSAMHGPAAAPWPRRRSPVSRRLGNRASLVSARMSIYESVFRTSLQVHAFIYEHTDGLIGHRMLGVPCLMLRTTGRKTGQTRTNSLVYAKDGDRYLVVASKGGDPKAPAWLLNLRAKPEVQVRSGAHDSRRPAPRSDPTTQTTPVCGSSSTTTTATGTTHTKRRPRGRSQSSL